ncbi:MAG: hypothetical protein RL748_942, partial [Pseudomonadota bacterium]
GTELQVRTLYFDGSHLLLGLFNGGLWQYQPGDKGRSASLVQPAGFADLTDQRVDVVLRDAPGSLWVGTRNGLNRVVPGQATQKIFPDPSNPQALPAGLISTLLMDQKGRLWVGTQGGGIAVLRGPGNKPQFQRIGLAEGLANMNIDQLLLDQSGRIWASTDAGIASIDADTLKVTMQRTADGVRIPSYWGGAGVSSSNGELLFGGAGGLTVIQPALRQAWQYQPPVLITDVRIKGKPVNAGALNLPLPDLAPFTIEPDANSIAVEFAALDYSAPELNRYAYRMDGYDADWIETDASRRIVSYTNLAPGNYRLRLRGSNRNGQWSEPERVLPLRVLPAWYQTWAWYGFCMVSTLLLLWQLFRSRTRFMRRRQYELERQIEQHTRQLREQHAELLQQAKLASLGTLTAGVAHEINNPANFALVGSYNLAQQLAQFHDVLLQLAGDEATPDFIDLLDQRFAALNGSLAAISEGTERIRDLVKDLRTFSRLEESNVKSVVLTDSLRATINLVRTQYAEGMRIECDLQANPELECSPVQLNQVFMNLMVNAWQAISIRSPEQQAAQAGCLAIRSYLESDFLVFEFEDNGVGIPEQSLPHIFDPFFTTKGVGQGMGMGLSVAFGIMEQHHGSISVRSELGKGTCFTLRLPVANSQPDGNSK